MKEDCGVEESRSSAAQRRGRCRHARSRATACGASACLWGATLFRMEHFAYGAQPHRRGSGRQGSGPAAPFLFSCVP